MQRQRTAPSGATWLIAWALALAIASTIELLTAVDGQQLPSTPSVGCASSASCSR